MADEKKPDGQNKKRRGRPPKVEVEPVVNETPAEDGERVEMANPPSNSAMNGLSGIWKSVLKGSSGTVGLGNVYNLNKYNPFLQNQRLKMLNTTPSVMSRDDLLKALGSPQDYEEGLRGEGWALSSKQYMYYKILRLAADIPMYKWYVLPQNIDDKGEYSKKEFVSEDKYVNDWMKVFDPQNSLRRIALEVKREGKATYVLRNSVTCDKSGERTVQYALFQKLPSNYVKLVKIGPNGFIASFNMLIFMNPAFSPEQYPPFIQEIWADMVDKGIITQNIPGMRKYSFDVDAASTYSYHFKDEIGYSEDLYASIETIDKKRVAKAVGTSYMFWVQLPQTLCYTFCSDTSHVWTIPDTAGLLLSLDELADYDTLQGLIDSTPLTTLLTAEADLINDPNPGQDQTSLNPETIYGLQDKFNESTSTNLEAFFAPLKNFKLLSLPAQPNGSDISANATKNVITRAGLGGLMITTDKPSVSQTKTAQMLAEAECDFVTRQFESVLNMIINDIIGCKYRWKLCIWGGRFTFGDEVSRDKELFVAGATFVLPKIASAYNMSLRDVSNTQDYIDQLGIYDGFKTITQAMQLKIGAQNTGVAENKQETKRIGRPPVAENDIDNDNTAASKDGGLDTSDTRM